MSKTEWCVCDAMLTNKPTNKISSNIIKSSWRQHYQDYRVKEGIEVFLPTDLEIKFESVYVRNSDPWDYVARGVEQVRFEYVVSKVKELNSQRGTMLDVGCSLGQLTHQLVGISDEFYSMDVSYTAVKKARENCAKIPGGESIRFLCASATDIPFKDNFFDLVILSDLLNGGDLESEQKKAAMSEAFRVLKPGCYVLLTDYLNPRDFQGHIDIVKTTSFQLCKTDYLCDRLGFQITTNLRPIKNWPGVKQILGSVGFMKFLAQISKPFARVGSKHLALTLRKPG